MIPHPEINAYNNNIQIKIKKSRAYRDAVMNRRDTLLLLLPESVHINLVWIDE